MGVSSDLRICVAVTSPYHWDRGVTFSMSARSPTNTMIGLHFVCCPAGKKSLAHQLARRKMVRRLAMIVEVIGKSRESTLYRQEVEFTTFILKMER